MKLASLTTLALVIGMAAGTASADVFIDFGGYGTVDPAADAAITSSDFPSTVNGFAFSATGASISDRARDELVNNGAYTLAQMGNNLIQKIDSLTVSGFDPLETYEIRIWALDPRNDEGEVYTFTDATTGFTGVSPVNHDYDDYTPLPSDNNAHSFLLTGVTGVSSITWDITTANGSAPKVNGIQIVPEPASLALLGLGGLCLLPRRRR